MNIIEVRLFELACKGERLDEINAEEILNQRAAAQARTRALRLYLYHLGQQWKVWGWRKQRMSATSSGRLIK
jgi:hypothetical protein